MLTLNTNLRNMASTQISYDFNSYCKFGDNYLACADDKICQLTGNTFDGVDITASAKTFNNRFGYSGKKKFRYLYLCFEADGDLSINVYVDDALVEAIPVVPLSIGRQYIRVSVGRDAIGRYWSFEINNVTGSWFSLEVLEGLPVYVTKGKM